MLVLNSRLTNVPIMSLQTGGQLGTATEPIIDPRKLQVVAFYATGPRIHEASVLHISDIREFSPLGFIVDSADSIMALDHDLIRLQQVINFRFNLLGKPVIDEHKKRLGKVTEYSVENEGFFIQKIHVSQSILKNLTNANLIIHRSQIVELTDKEVIVRSATVQEATGLTQMLNPFRKTSQPLAPEQVEIDAMESPYDSSVDYLPGTRPHHQS